MISIKFPDTCSTPEILQKDKNIAPIFKNLILKSVDIVNELKKHDNFEDKPIFNKATEYRIY